MNLKQDSSIKENHLSCHQVFEIIEVDLMYRCEHCTGGSCQIDLSLQLTQRRWKLLTKMTPNYCGSFLYERHA